MVPGAPHISSRAGFDAFSAIAEARSSSSSGRRVCFHASIRIPLSPISQEAVRGVKRRIRLCLASSSVARAGSKSGGGGATPAACSSSSAHITPAAPK